MTSITLAVRRTRNLLFYRISGCKFAELTSTHTKSIKYSTENKQKKEENSMTTPFYNYDFALLPPVAVV